MTPPRALTRGDEKFEQSDFYELRWSDEFDQCPNRRPNQTTWASEVGWIRNDELQYYREENAECRDDGVLEITSRFHPTAIPNPRHDIVAARPECMKQPPEPFCEQGTRPLSYTSSSFTTRPEHTGSLGLGQYDARIRIETEVNSWPAWWMVGDGNHLWPQDGEVDSTLGVGVNPQPCLPLARARS